MKTGLITKTTGSWHTVNDDGSFIRCKMKGTYRQKGIKTTNPVAVGDHVDYESDDNKTGLITEIHPRKNYIIRKSINLSKEAHILAANLDQAILIFTLAYPETPLEFIDRFLVSAEAYHIPSRLVINKTDIYDEKTTSVMYDLIAVYSKIGYPCLQVSAVTHSNIERLKDVLKNKTSLVAGNSGVGKTTLINFVQPGLNLKVDDISMYHKTGKHTTTFSEMFPLDIGGYVIDSPGIKGFGVIDFEKSEVGLFFPEIFTTSVNCQYYNCSHSHEPGCAVKEAVESGSIARSRYRSYLSILADSNSKYRAGS